MLMRRKEISAASEAIIREQRTLKKEKFLANPALIIGAAGLVLIVLLAIFVPIFHPTDPNAMEVTKRLQALIFCLGGVFFGGTVFIIMALKVKLLTIREWLLVPFGKKLLKFGRDLFVRMMYGARVSLWVGGCVAVFSCVLGTIIGIYASYFKVLDQVLMRICDGLIAIPGILLAIALIAALGTSSWNVILALTIVYTPSVARTVRASALVIREQTYVEAAKVQGFSNFRILWRMILPGVISPLTVQASFIFAQAIISEASLSFLGAGIPAPAASWGNMLESSKMVFSRAPWTMICPGAAVILCVLSLNLLGDGLRDYLDPKVKGGKKKA